MKPMKCRVCGHKATVSRRGNTTIIYCPNRFVTNCDSSVGCVDPARAIAAWNVMQAPAKRKAKK